MQRDPRFEALLHDFSRRAPGPTGLLQKIGAFAAAAILFGLALTFSVIFLAVVVAAGVVIWGYVWWRTRDLRKAMREAQAQAQARGPARRSPTPGDGIVIEGEVVREIHDEQGESRRG